jgi:hypothetical protein
MTLWNEERIELLKNLLLVEKKSTGKIAAILGIGRGAVSGKCRRLGIRISEATGNIVRGRHVVKVVKRLRSMPTGQRFKVVEEIVKPNYEKISPKSFNVTLMDLSVDKCHWPMWGDGAPFEQQFYCGETCVKGLYCQEHHNIAHYNWRRVPVSSFRRHIRPANSPKSIV